MPTGEAFTSASSFITAISSRSPGHATPTALPPLNPGTVLLDQFRVVELLGRGGAAVVYRAEHLTLGEEIALKAVPSFGQAQAVAQVLAGEYRAQRKIKDMSHILRAEAPLVAQAEGVDWVLLPMELAQKSLRDWLQETDEDHEGRLGKGMALLQQVAEGLSAIHRAGLVHLDLKPENVLLVKEGKDFVAKVADFGLSRGLAKLEETRPQLFGDGVGTPAYMAPEQVLAAHWKDVGPGADIYALGMMLFELLDRDLPYSGSGASIREKKLNEKLKIRRPEGPTHLADLALRLLGREAGARPELEDVAQQLVEVTPEERAAWEKARTADTEESYERYLTAHEGGAWMREATQRHNELKAERGGRAEAQAREKAEAERKATEEAERKAAAEAERKNKADADRKAEAEAEAKLKADAEEKAEAAKLRWETKAKVRAKKKAEAEKKVKEIFDPEMVRIRAGTFLMGDSREGPPHRVRLTRDFLIQRTPVTQGQWEAMMGNNPSHFKGDDRRPVENVSWDDAQAFIQKLNRMASRGRFRLPTEAEWEYACRGGTTGEYGGAGSLEDMGWYHGNSGGTTHPVGEKEANEWGLYDMHGNVSEWCQDWWEKDYYGKSPDVDPVYREVEFGLVRVVRGGMFGNEGEDVRSAARSGAFPATANFEIGFRLARTL